MNSLYSIKNAAIRCENRFVWRAVFGLSLKHLSTKHLRDPQIFPVKAKVCNWRHVMFFLVHFWQIMFQLNKSFKSPAYLVVYEIWRRKSNNVQVHFVHIKYLFSRWKPITQIQNNTWKTTKRSGRKKSVQYEHVEIKQREERKESRLLRHCCGEDTQD